MRMAKEVHLGRDLLSPQACSSPLEIAGQEWIRPEHHSNPHSLFVSEEALQEWLLREGEEARRMSPEVAELVNAWLEDHNHQ